MKIGIREAIVSLLSLIIFILFVVKEPHREGEALVVHRSLLELQSSDSRLPRIAVLSWLDAPKLYVYTKNGDLLWERKPNAAEGAFIRVKGIPDVNGDSIDDVVVATNLMRIVAFSGSNGSILWQRGGLGENVTFGYGLDIVPDATSDGVWDVSVGAPSLNPYDPSYVYLYSGRDGRLVWKVPHKDSWEDPVGLFGVNVAGISDANGDGFGDVAVAAPLANTGTEKFIGAVVWLSGVNGKQFRIVFGERHKGGAWSTIYLSAMGDINQDGAGDLFVGTPGYWDTSQGDIKGKVYAYFSPYSWNRLGEQLQAHYGYAVNAGWDFTGDGLSDVVVGAPDFDVNTAGTSEGKVYVYNSGGDLVWSHVGSSVKDNFGKAVSGIFDIDGDGAHDLVVGVPKYFAYSSRDIKLTKPGEIHVYSGRTGALLWKKQGEPGSDHFGVRVSGIPAYPF